ncbi:hypothetical protein P3T76_013830 [Phytophthora citrophthora]|uniref:Uncharacterized protein n=1 Tax=Phytophthora citrophthora TaxID=4793 RepID=A0AAD9G2U7_9STRA|nr:hypothetical protein P3T76_013830 [Phytophthora citrophthora]
MINEFMIKLEIAGSGYHIFPIVHVSKLKLVRIFPDQPRVELAVNEADCLAFDETLLPEDSWVPDLGADEYEVERVSNMWCGKGPATAESTESFWYTGSATTNRLGLMRQTSTVELY